MSTIARSATLLPTAAGPVHVVVHHHAARPQRDTAVMLLPPFGLDDVCSYRPRRDWADALATAGHVALRLSYPGAGDSGGTPDDPDLLDAWTTATVETGRWLRDAMGRPRLAVIGIELGGLIACRAVASGALTVDDLVLWATPATGRQLVRRLQAFSNLEVTADDPAPDPVADDSDGVTAGGFRLSAATVAALRTLDVGHLPGLGDHLTRVLLLGRDELAPDNRLRNLVAESGAAMTRLPGHGYSAMTAPSFEAATPETTIRAVGEWLHGAAGPLRGGAPDPSRLVGADPVEIVVPGGGTIGETQLDLEGPSGILSGVLTDPAPGLDRADLCVLYLDTGTIRRIGTNRLWVEAARRWAARGVASVRFDMDGMGDSDGDPSPYRDLSKLYDPWIVAQVTTVIDQLQARGVAQRFAVAGLSAGAYWALHASLRDDRVGGLALMNPGALVWDPGTSPHGDFRTMRTILQTRSLSLATLRKALGPRGLALAVWLGRALAARLVRRGDAAPLLVGRADEMREVIGEIEAMDVPRLLVFCEDEPSVAEIIELGLYESLRATPGVEVLRIRTGDHFVRPLWAQRELHAGLDRWLAQVVAAAPARPTGSLAPGAPAPPASE